MADLTYPIFLGPAGAEPVAHIRAVASAVQPTIGDALYAGQILRTRIRQRTAAGIDAEGSPFAPYSEAYRKRKIALLGHADAVDLFGPTDPGVHMLNTMMVRCGGVELAAGDTASEDPMAMANPANLFHLGFYSEEASRARIHNEGGSFRTRLGSGKRKPKPGGKPVASMPRRHFFDANQSDLDLMGDGIRRRMLMRAGAV